jgi:hypothetical protein
MEGQQRANAAQLAARNIKQPKGRQRKTPLKSNGNVQQSMQFGGSSGLFGGLAPPTGSFDFSAPGGLSFPPSSFGNGNTSGNSFSSPDISENEADPRADTTGEELLRRNRSFQTGNDPALFHTPGAFGGIQSTNSNPFGQASPQLKPADNPFSFKATTSQPPTSSVFNFNSTSTATEGNPFAFQPSTPKEPAPSAFKFNPVPTQDKPTSNPFSFLSSQGAPSSPSLGSGAQSLQDKPGNNTFGGLTQPAAPNPVFNFGSPAGQDKPAPASPSFVFGQSSTQPASNVDSDSDQAAEKPPSLLFGAFQQTQAPAASAFSFGPQTATQPNIFADTNFPASPASSLFGNQKSVQPSNDLFGAQGQQQNATSVTSASDELLPNTRTAEVSKSQSALSSNIFANAGKAAPATATLFGSPGKQTAPATSLFAGSNGQSASTSGLFGNLNKPVQQSLAKPEDTRSLTNGTNLAKDSTLSTIEASSQSLFGKAPSNVSEPATSLVSCSIYSLLFMHGTDILRSSLHRLHLHPHSPPAHLPCRLVLQIPLPQPQPHLTIAVMFSSR